MPIIPAREIDRRTALKGAGAGLLVAGLASGGVLLSRSAASAASNPGGWATGGTAAMRNAAAYPDPFALADRACSITCEQILGPCWAPKAPLRQDISEGEPGIPTRMAFRLIGAEDCAPIAGAEVEIWHTNWRGTYSGDDVEGREFCTTGDEHAEASYFCRGRAISDGDGRVSFDSCFPGWYGSRALHVHLLARMPEHAGEATASNLQLVTQFYFPEELTEQVHGSVEGYAERGQPDTSNSRDSVLRRSGDAEAFIFGTQQMDDGTLLAWKTIAISGTQRCGSRGFGRRF